MSSESLRRLSTFGRWPMPSGGDGDACSDIKFFVSKFVEAYFERSPECTGDEVVCKSCGVMFGDWKGESPAAVHRVISPNCPALNPADDHGARQRHVEVLRSLRGNPYVRYLPNQIQQQIQSTEGQAGWRTPEQSSYPPNNDSAMAGRVRRSLFTEPLDDPRDDQEAEGDHTVSRSERPTVQRILDQPPITHPFQTKCGGYNNLFASNRLQTFPNSINCLKFQTWAEEGFVFSERQQDVMCVFCGTVLVLNGHQPKKVHERACYSCPFLIGFDVGNISQQEEKDIRMKYFQQQAAKNRCSLNLVVKYPQYEKDPDRQGTFQGWPKMCARKFPSELMVACGFYYSGCSDKVVCYSCGVELYDWSEDADVWKTHAKVSPTCLHVINQKGQEFITQAANTEVLVEVKYPASGPVTNSGGVMGEEPGSSNLNMTAVKAALARGYTLLQIQHAIIKFFSQTSRYPNEAILKASLKAADENQFTICKQQVDIHQKDTVIQEQGTELRQSYTVIQEQGTELRQSYTVIQEQGTELQQKEQTVQAVQQQLAEKDGQLAETVAQMAEKDEQLTQKDEQLTQKDGQLDLMDQQIRSLMQQVHQLRADQNQQVNAAPGPRGDGANSDEHRQSLMCKICMSDKPRMIFLPCGHLFSCAECTSRLPDKRCPVCRQDISDVLPAFVA